VEVNFSDFSDMDVDVDEKFTSTSNIQQNWMQVNAHEYLWVLHQRYIFLLSGTSPKIRR